MKYLDDFCDECLSRIKSRSPTKINECCFMCGLQPSEASECKPCISSLSDALLRLLTSSSDGWRTSNLVEILNLLVFYAKDSDLERVYSIVEPFIQGITLNEKSKTGLCLAAISLDNKCFQAFNLLHNIQYKKDKLNGSMSKIVVPGFPEPLSTDDLWNIALSISRSSHDNSNHLNSSNTVMMTQSRSTMKVNHQIDSKSRRVATSIIEECNKMKNRHKWIPGYIMKQIESTDWKSLASFTQPYESYIHIRDPFQSFFSLYSQSIPQATKLSLSYDSFLSISEGRGTVSGIPTAEELSIATLYCSWLFLDLDRPCRECGGSGIPTDCPPYFLYEAEEQFTAYQHYLQDHDDTNTSNAFDYIYFYIASRIAAAKGQFIEQAALFKLFETCIYLLGHQWWYTLKIIQADREQIKLYNDSHIQGQVTSMTSLTSTSTQKKFDTPTAKSIWEDEKKRAGFKPCPIIDTIMNDFIGMEGPKKACISLYDRVFISTLRGDKRLSIPLNFRVVGNPGTGKSTFARALATLLMELGLRPSDNDPEGDRVREDAIKKAEYDKQVLKDTQIKEKFDQLSETILTEKVSHAELMLDLLHTSKVDMMNASSRVTLLNNERDGLRTYKHVLDETIQYCHGKMTTLDRDISSAESVVNKLRHDLQIHQQQKLASNQATLQATMNATASQQAIPPPRPQRYIETSGGTLVQKGSTYLDELIQPLLEDSIPGGIIFIDEAHQLDPLYKPKGMEVIHRIVKLSEDYRDILSFILAGYPKDIEKLLESDDGLRRRFPALNSNLFHLSDYNCMELTDIFNVMLRKLPHSMTLPPWKLQREEDAEVIGRRVARGAGVKGFGNAGDVKNLLEGIILNNHANRLNKLRKSGKELSSYDLVTLTTEDMLGHRPDPNTSKVMKKMNTMIGLQNIKDSFMKLIDTLQQIWDAEVRGELSRPIGLLNRVLLGSPGTGKTTVAKLYAELLKECGFLTSGELIVTLSSDFVGSALGQSEAKTAAILDKSKGNVLFIDEAYSLSADTPYHRAVIDALVGGTPTVGGSDMAVVLAGYTDEMTSLLDMSHNPGLSSRFPKQVRYEFMNYTVSELRKILLDYGSQPQRKLYLSYAVADKASRHLGNESKLKNFSNARAAENFINTLMDVVEKRYQDMGMTLSTNKQNIVTIADVDAVIAMNSDTEDDSSFDLLPEIKTAIQRMADEVQLSLACHKKNPTIKHMVLTGNSGTGKSTSARAIAKLMYTYGLLPTKKTVEISAEDMQAGYVGQTSNKIKELLDQAQGGVLFIDEAHRLKPSRLGDFKSEILGTLVASMTSPSYMNKILIILAGYKADIDEMLQGDQGLRRRFNIFIHLPDIDIHTGYIKLIEILTKDNFQLPSVASEIVIKKCIKTLKALPGWGNIGDIKTLSDKLFICAASRLSQANVTYQQKNHHSDSADSVSSTSSTTRKIDPRSMWNGVYTEDDVKKACQSFVLERQSVQPMLPSDNDVTTLVSDMPMVAGYCNTSQKPQMTTNTHMEIQEDTQDSDDDNNLELDMSTALNNSDELKDIVRLAIESVVNGKWSSKDWIQAISHENEDKYKLIFSNITQEIQNTHPTLSNNTEILTYIDTILNDCYETCTQMNDDLSRLNKRRQDDAGVSSLLIALKAEEEAILALKAKLEAAAALKAKEEAAAALKAAQEAAAALKAKLETAAALKAKEEAILASTKVICGHCRRENSSTSGCAYRGNTDYPITINLRNNKVF